MEKVYLGIDAGSISIKGIIINEDNNILTSDYFYIKNNPITSVKKIINNLKKEIDTNKYKIASVGVTGYNRKLIGKYLKANIIKNEITAHTVGTTSIYNDVKTIIEMGNQDFKIIFLNNGIITGFKIKNIFFDNLNIDKNKKIISPIVFQGGMSKNKKIIKQIENKINAKVIVDKNSHLMGALGVAILSKKTDIEKEFNFNI